MSPLQRYMMQRGQAAQGAGPRGAGGMPAAPVGPGIADPYTEGDVAPPLVTPDDGEGEFDPRKRRRYLEEGSDMPADVNAMY